MNVTNLDTSSIPINVDYTQWGGIYRDVELISTSDQYISLEDYGNTGVYIDSSVNGLNANINLKTEISNKAEENSEINIRTEVFDMKLKMFIYGMEQLIHIYIWLKSLFLIKMGIY